MIYEFHEIADIFPLLGSDEYSELVDSIKKNGLREPIWLFEGKILDGRNRYRACIDAGADSRFEEYDGDYLSAVEFVWDENYNRRHLNSSQSAAVIICKEELVSKFREKAKAAQVAGMGADGSGGRGRKKNLTQQIEQGLRNDRSTTARLAKLSGTNRQYIADAMKLRTNQPDEFIAIKDGKKTITQVKRELRGKARKERMAILSNIPNITERYELYVCSVDCAKDVADDSVDWIITDPPYPYDYIEVYSSLSETAARVLKPGGSCLVMAGQSYLPEILERLRAHMEYQWTIAYLTPGGQSAQLWDRSVNAFWKPVLWLVKGGYSGDWIGDVVKSDANDKRFHDWGQSEGGMADLIGRFSYPGDVIYDPFVGGGTTGVVAVAMDRKFIGSDIDPACIETTKARIAGLSNG